MAELEKDRRVILTGQIFNDCETCRKQMLLPSKSNNGNAAILTFILTLAF
jgi:hypothetical protein